MLSAEQQKAADAKTKLEKYIFYFRRFQDHGKSAETAIKQLPAIDQKMEKLQSMNKGGDLKKFDFLSNGVKLIIESRRTLRWSYAYAYYLKDRSRQKTLFEQDQAMLEKFADHLHELCEKPLEELSQEAKRKEILNYSTAAGKVCNLSLPFPPLLLFRGCRRVLSGCVVTVFDGIVGCGGCRHLSYTGIGGRKLKPLISPLALSHYVELCSVVNDGINRPSHTRTPANNTLTSLPISLSPNTRVVVMYIHTHTTYLHVCMSARGQHPFFFWL